MTEEKADKVAINSVDEDEWDDQPVKIESRPSGSQVISARLPTALAEELLAEAGRRHVKPSELVRQAVEHLLRPGYGVATMNTTACRVRVVSPANQYQTENPNLVVENVPEKSTDGGSLTLTGANVFAAAA